MERKRIDLGIREMIQTCGPIHDSFSPEALPPPELVASRVHSMIDQMYPDQGIRVELPPGTSNPAATKNLVGWLTHAYRRGIELGDPSFITLFAIHQRWRPSDVSLHLECIREARKCAGVGQDTPGPALHLFGNVSPLSIHSRDFSHWRDKLGEIVDMVETDNTPLRISFEHLGQSDIRHAEALFNLALEVNRTYGKKIVQYVGAPDTNGENNIKKYREITAIAGRILSGTGVTFCIHVHDDQGMGLELVQNILDVASKFEDLLVEPEVVDGFNTGERNGTKPRVSDLQSLGYGQDRVPTSFTRLFKGNSWRHDPTVDQEKVRKTPVSGVHAIDPYAYLGSSRILTPGEIAPAPHPAVYGIMGPGNLGYYAEHHLNGNNSLSEKQLKQMAIATRALAGEYGHLPHAYLIAALTLAVQDWSIIKRSIDNIGSPETWIKGKSINLTELRDGMEAVVYEHWPGMSDT